ncbi:hypothetical protein R9X47_24125 [Wukongibacter baidiensis]|uniref:hypothetical protein n=1 Tax=Wukongibacter baidiensis TaxID=1723361 RepID=UPI003D7F6214
MKLWPEKGKYLCRMKVVEEANITNSTIETYNGVLIGLYCANYISNDENNCESDNIVGT